MMNEETDKSYGALGLKDLSEAHLLQQELWDKERHRDCLSEGTINRCIVSLVLLAKLEVVYG